MEFLVNEIRKAKNNTNRNLGKSKFEPVQAYIPHRLHEELTHWKNQYNISLDLLFRIILENAIKTKKMFEKVRQ